MVDLADTQQQKVLKMHPSAAGVTSKSETQLKDLRKRKINATVIPAPRKSVKRMMFESMVDFLARLFSSEGNQPKKVGGCFKMNPMERATCCSKTKRIYARSDYSDQC